VFPGLLILLFSPHGSVDDEVAGHEQLWIDSILVFNWNVVTIFVNIFYKNIKCYIILKVIS